jgi:hypothetical protein
MPRSAVGRTAVCLALAGWLLSGSLALAASPTPGPLASGDVRTGGEGAGLVGAPFLAAGGVVVVGLLAAGLTIAYVRYGRGGSQHP